MLTSAGLSAGCGDDLPTSTTEAMTQSSNIAAAPGVEPSASSRAKRPPPSKKIKGGLASADHLDAGVHRKLTEAIKIRRSDVLECYESELESDASLKGKLDIVLDVYDTKAIEIEIAGMTESLHTCVTERIAAWPFPGVDDATSVKLAYHLQPE